MTGSRIPRWEAQLWNYVSNGDGKHCPIYERCQLRRRGGWCISDHTELLDILLDSSRFNSSYCDFPEWETPGRIFNLVKMLAKSFLKKGRVDSPPVPSEIVFLCDDELLVEVRFVPLMTHRGAIWRLQDSWVIQLNENDSSARRRFSLFHEAFHILAHRKATPVFRKRGNDVGSFNELLAEYFAVCVLMPRQWIEEKWEEVKDVHRMAEIFDVTESTMWLRLRSLRLIQ